MTTAAETRRNLHLIRDYWGDLLAARHTDPAPTWPPQRLSTEMWAIRDQQAAEERADRNDHALGDSPAPVANLDALQAAEDITTAMLDLADQVAASCQRPLLAVPHNVNHATHAAALAAATLDATDPRRWHYNTSWSKGVHWACVYVDGRIAGDDLDDGLFRALPAHLEHEAAAVAAQCAQRVMAVLGLADRSAPIPDRPCPWCGGELRLHQLVDDAPTVTCSTGRSCTAPTPYDDRGRRTWNWHNLHQLAQALKHGTGEPTT